MRDNTERPITVTMEKSRLTRLETLMADVTAALEAPASQRPSNPYWDGGAAERVAASWQQRWADITLLEVHTPARARAGSLGGAIGAQT